MSAAQLTLARSPQELRAALSGGGRVGLVPTMGYLHAGHASHIERARAAGERVVVSLFINPLQFGAGEDLSRYPRDLERDTALAARAGAEVLFLPDAATMYPPGFDTRIEVGAIGEVLEGAARPGHFSGVATVVLKLLNLVRPDTVYFGEKDWQQLAVIKQVVRDLNVPVTVRGGPTVREPSGLAMSSRNSYLNPEQRERMGVIARALRAMQAAHAAGERDVELLRQAGLAVLAGEPELALDYLSVVNFRLMPLENVQNDPEARILIAARAFGVRLIDNMPLRAAQE